MGTQPKVKLAKRRGFWLAAIAILVALNLMLGAVGLAIIAPKADGVIAAGVSPERKLSATATDSQAHRLVVSTLTAVPEAEPSSPATPLPCNLAAAGVPLTAVVPANSPLATGRAFTTTLRLKNTGSCAWSEGYGLVWVAGDRFSRQDRFPIAMVVAPGETLVMELGLLAPDVAGEFAASWKLMSDAGQLFGLGQDGAAPITLSVVVGEVVIPDVTGAPSSTRAATVVPTTPTQASSPTPIPSLTASPTVPAPTATPSPSPTVAVGEISGRLLIGGAPASVNTVVALEDAGNLTIATQGLDFEGRFTFAGVALSSSGYQVVFTQATNEHYSMTEVISWGWIGPVSVTSHEPIQVGDLEIGLFGLEPVQPPPDSSYSVAAISAGSPLRFEWTAYPQADAYWVDITQRETQAAVWQSGLGASHSLLFDGTLLGGTRLIPGDYGWAVGARRQIGAYDLVVYGYLAALHLTP